VNNRMSESTYGKLHDEVIKANMLCSITAETITPMFIGGYDGKCYHGRELAYEGIRESSIKGVWRWWVRALLTAAIAKRHSKYVLLDSADEYASRILGSTRKPSKYTIVVNVIKSSYVFIRNYGNILGIPRVELLLKRKDMRDEAVIAPNTLFRINVYRNTDTNREEDEFAIWSLIVSLLFDGIGKGSSRGFGKVKILNRENYVRDLNNLLQKLYSSRKAEEIEKNLKEIINKAVEKAENVLELLEIKPRELRKLSDKPLIEIPLIKEQLMIIKVPRKWFGRAEDATRAIGNATLKLYYKTLNYVKKGFEERQARQRAVRESGKSIHTWILGLPRAQEPPIIQDGKKVEKLRNKLKNELEKLRQRGFYINRANAKKLIEMIKYSERVVSGKKVERVEIPTGYYHLGGEGRDLRLRRRSPIRFTVIRTDDDRYFIAIYAFKSYDWERKRIINFLVHIGAYYIKIRTERGRKTVDVQYFSVTPITNINIDEVLLNIVNNAKEIIETFR